MRRGRGAGDRRIAAVAAPRSPASPTPHGRGIARFRARDRVCRARRHVIPSGQMSTVNQWIVGLDLNERSHGALVFASWLSLAGDAITGVHVVEECRRRYTPGDVLPAVEAAVARTTQALGCAPPTKIVTFDASTAELSLVRAAEGAAGLILG